MTKLDIAAEVAERTSLNKGQSEEAVVAMIAALKDALKDKERIQFQGFGTFETVEKPGRIARNPGTGAEVEVPSHFAVKFKPSSLLKSYVNE